MSIASKIEQSTWWSRWPLMGLGIALLTFLLIGVYLQHDFNKKISHDKPIPTVVIATSRQKNIPIYLDGLGTVTPLHTITVRTQINGQLWQVLFKEGQFVKKGEQIAQIDPRFYEAQLLQYQGQLDRDNALLANARIDLKRYQTLWKQDSVSQQVLATQAALVQQYEGLVKNDEGLIASTNVNLIYCRITSPINGRIGLRLVDAGNFVQTTDTAGIAVINTVHPITVIFSVAEDYVATILPRLKNNQPLVVKAYDRQQNHLLATGKLLTLDNQIDPTTGTVKLRAQFTNTNNALFPNQFVNIKLRIDTRSNAIIIPSAALQYNTQGDDFVYVVDTNHTVRIKTIGHGDTTGDYTVVTKGLKLGESVVIEGAYQLKNGMTVNTSNALDKNRLLPNPS